MCLGRVINRFPSFPPVCKGTVCTGEVYGARKLGGGGRIAAVGIVKLLGTDVGQVQLISMTAACGAV